MRNCKPEHKKPRDDNKRKIDLFKYHQESPQLIRELQACDDHKGKENKLLGDLGAGYCRTIIRMKDQALQKATQMIELLYQENNELENQVQSLRQQLEAREHKIMQLRQLIQCQIQKQQAQVLPDLYQQEVSKNRSAIVASDYYLSFSQPRTKSLEHEDMYNEIMSGFIKSKEFQPWETQQASTKTMDQVISYEEASNNEVKKLDKQASTQRSLELNKAIKKKNIKQTKEYMLYQSQQVVENNKKSARSQDQSTIQSFQALIQSYQQIICSFRQRQASLMSCLNQSFDFIAKTGQHFRLFFCQTQKNLDICSNLLHDFKSLEAPIRLKLQQNHQLRVIIDELLKNIEVVKSNIPPVQ